jgi:hypothetical protein
VGRQEKNMRNLPAKTISPTITIHISGSLYKGHLSYLDQLVASAIDCALWPLLDLARLAELDRVALTYLIGGEGRDFGIVACPNFVREWMQNERSRIAAA